MAVYNWQRNDWPHFTYHLKEVENSLLLLAEKTGHISGILKALPESVQSETIIELMVAEAIKTSEIEGEYFSRQDVMSSIKKNLGLQKSPETIRNKKAEGIGELMSDVRKTFQERITAKKLFSWHSMLMADRRNVLIGAWRKHTEPMQVISGAIEKEKIHYEAPPSVRVPAEMKQFISWFNATGPGGQKEIPIPVIRSAIAHLYFETIHPFEDGNGRIGRAIAEKCLSQGLGRPVLLSLSRTIEANKRAYYDALQEAQRSNEITPWINYFVQLALDAQTEAEEQVEFTLRKVKFFDKFGKHLNERQQKVVTRMLEEGPKGFKGGMSASKYGSLAKTSKATATRDLQDLLDKGVFILMDEGGGRNTKYQIHLT
ncbi:MAG: Fic family protein [Candidatus Pseudobacter hemicellulosilyticus]|uniref:Fic family protein n=1 Tax=Candidatus Pseudobacter hemicellulosilyticus TaxID=3121375 RepID=A0AAJ6BGP8_9BACT|nr:MAG: Fic family protein [Pseudobacter sp.]